jgi:hypothetical protein
MQQVLRHDLPRVAALACEVIGFGSGPGHIVHRPMTVNDLEKGYINEPGLVPASDLRKRVVVTARMQIFASS